MLYCSLNYKNVSKIHFVFLMFLKYSVLQSTIKTRRVNVVSEMTVRGFMSKLRNNPVVLLLLLLFSPPRSTECVYAASEASLELFYTLIGLFWWLFARRVRCRHIFFKRSSSLLTCPLCITAVRNPRCKEELHG